MLKFILQCLTALIIITITVYLKLHWGITIVFVIVGFLLTHFIWDRYLFNAYAYLGAMPVDPNDPILKKAENQSRKTLKYFITNLFPENKDNSMIKFIYKNASGEKEKLWADLLSISENKFKVFVRTPPMESLADFDRTMYINNNDIVDWSVAQKDGSILGGYTNFALFKIFEREEGYMHPKFKKHISRFKELEKAN